MKKIILDLCGGTGAWSNPYKNAGYDVKVITLPNFDILLTRMTNDGVWFSGGEKDNDLQLFIPKGSVYGILSAPPCTHFAVSGARWWKTKDPQLLKTSLDIVDIILDLIPHLDPVFWAMENPVGRLKTLRYDRLGEPKLIFNPCDFGDPYTKKTLLWGQYNLPKKNPVKPTNADYNKIHYPRNSAGKAVAWNSAEAKELRSITPQGFAKAFYEANNNMKKEKTLREHLSEIAKQRHIDLKKKLGKKGYSEMMQKVSLSRFNKNTEKEVSQDSLSTD